MVALACTWHLASCGRRPVAVGAQDQIFLYMEDACSRIGRAWGTEPQNH